jgi:hypothetical protein
MRSEYQVCGDNDRVFSCRKTLWRRGFLRILVLKFAAFAKMKFVSDDKYIVFRAERCLLGMICQ